MTSGATVPGMFSLVLHSHLPWLANHGRWPVGEEWLYQSWADCYLPLTAVLEQLAEDGHTDVLSLGILGDARRHTCTAISASVNMASRLEGLTKQLGCRILASEAVIDQLAPSARDDVKMRLIGDVVVGSVGNDLRMDYTAVGDTTNVAARLQQAATPGHVIVSEPIDGPFGRTFTFADPDGYQVTLHDRA